MILIIDNGRRSQRCLSDMLAFMGIPSATVKSEDAASEVSTMFRAIIVNATSHIPDINDFLKRLRSYSAGIPIFGIIDTDTTPARGFDAVFEKGRPASRMIREITEYARREQKLPPTHYALAGIDASIGLKFPLYFDYTIPLTKTESMILRVLMRAYPNPIKAEKILYYISRRRGSAIPCGSSVRTHISSINKKYKALFNRALIFPTQGEGYTVLTPEKMEEMGMIERIPSFA